MTVLFGLFALWHSFKGVRLLLEKSCAPTGAALLPPWATDTHIKLRPVQEFSGSGKGRRIQVKALACKADLWRSLKTLHARPILGRMCQRINLLDPRSSRSFVFGFLDSNVVNKWVTHIKSKIACSMYYILHLWPHRGAGPVWEFQHFRARCKLLLIHLPRVLVPQASLLVLWNRNSRIVMN